MIAYGDATASCKLMGQLKIIESYHANPCITKGEQGIAGRNAMPSRSVM
jgi:hypothetical protein